MSNLNFTLTSLVWFGFGFLSYLYVFLKHKQYRKELAVLLIIDLIATLNLAVNKTHEIIYGGILLITQSWGVLLYSEKDKMSIVDDISIILILYLTFRVATSKHILISAWQYGIKLSNLVFQNTVSIFLCEFLSYDILFRTYENKKYSYIIFIVAEIAAFISMGTGGILSVSIFTFGLLFLNRKNDEIPIWKIVVLMFFSLIALIVLNKFNYVISELTDDNGRIYIWTNYLRCMKSFKDIFFGADVSSVPFLVKANNMHNTFLNWHYCYGLIPFVFFIYRTFCDFNYCIKNRKHSILLVLIVCFIRSMTDETEFAFGGIWTFVWLLSRDNKKSKL